MTIDKGCGSLFGQGIVLLYLVFRGVGKNGGGREVNAELSIETSCSCGRHSFMRALTKAWQVDRQC